MNTIIFMLSFQLLLIALNAVFACAEIAIISAGDTRIERLSEQGNKSALRVKNLKKDPARFLATIQVAITLSGFLGSAFAADNFSEYLVNFLLALGIPAPVSVLDTVAVVCITLLLSYVTLIFGELVPKRIAMSRAESLALKMSSAIAAISKIFAPLVSLLTASTNGVLRLIGIDPQAEEAEVSEEDIRMMVDAGNKTGVIANEEKEMIHNIFEFDDLTVKDILTYRKQIQVLWMEESVEVWREKICHSDHGRFPVCRESLDHIVGVLDVMEFLKTDQKSRDVILTRAVKPAYFVPKHIKARQLLDRMKERKETFAVVLDEYGDLLGIVTMQDVLEQLIGDFAGFTESADTGNT